MRVIRLGLLGCSALVAMPMFSFAQEEADASAERTLDVVTVTAQNRAEDVQNVPIAINVIGGDALREAGVVDLQDLATIAPQVQIVSDTNITRVTIRGVGTNSNDEAQDSSVAINIDGEYMNRPNVLNASLFDIERVEVLRGPQGTLYGRNATGGAINFITRKPGDEFSFNGSVSYGSFEQLNIEAGMDIPLGDKMAIRVAATDVSNDGTVYHPNIDERSNNQDYSAARLSLRIDPTEKLSLYAAVDYVDVDQKSNNQAFVNFNATGFSADDGTGKCNTAAGWVEIAPLVPGVQCEPRNTNFLAGQDREEYPAVFAGVLSIQSEQVAVRGGASYDFGPVTLNYRIGHRDTSSPTNIPLSPAYTFLGFVDDTKTTSQELRLNSNNSDGIIWQGGVFLFSEELERDRGLFLPFIGPKGGFINYFVPSVESDSWAVFGQADVPVSENLTAVVGARYTSDERSAIYRNYGFNPNTGPVQLSQDPNRNPSILDLGSEDEQFTWLLGMNYQPNADQLLYGKVSTGFKAGGFDSVGTYAPETVTAFEVGSKNRLADGRYLLNVTGFYYDYSDLQVGVLLDSALGNQIFNVGAATIWGVEADFNVDITDHDRLFISANYLNAEYDDFLAAVPVQCLGCSLNAVADLDGDSTNGSVTQPNLAGNTPPRSPEWIISAGYDHDWDLGSGRMLTASVSTTYKSEYFNTVFNYNDGRQDAYTATDIYLTYDSGKAWSASVYGRNLEDERPLTYASFTSAGPDDIFNWQFGMPRTFGVRLAVEY